MRSCCSTSLNGCMCREEHLGFKIVLRTESDVEIMDDGYKWKKIKNTPHRRNYYRCAAEACKVKKRVERESQDPRFVMTTYEGNHNHPSPSLS
ncbi:hypothetical protein HRI_003889300 [Hibiscus trionum]|uniref:WRKY domain-containing protein n=1 Tax=Hibiscus trionum TaxID=183268 RepID=A0A9W7MLV8_HIBTR|nr:hypothetical protein HRI_003889300 [Hibiscus trionum]